MCVTWGMQTYSPHIEAIAANEMLGPDVSYVSGFIDKLDPYQGPTGRIVATREEAIAAIDTFHQQGYKQIKIYSSIKPDWVAPMAAHAHSLGMRVCGHIPAFMTAEEAIKDGYDEVIHMNFIFLNFMGDTVDTGDQRVFVWWEIARVRWI